MLGALIEAEGRAAILAAADGVDWPTALTLAHLDYLFSGQSPDRPGIWLAGGVTGTGQSVSGTGRSRADALRGVAGEMAEAALRAAAGLMGTGLDWGFGAHPDVEQARAHARAEVTERACVMDWWQGGAGARRLDCDPVQTRRDLHLIAVPAPADNHVVLAMSFDPDGWGFCFGAACRADMSRAADAAIVELAQSEFGLRLVRSRQGNGPMSDADRLTLRLAQIVQRDHIQNYVCSVQSHIQGAVPEGVVKVAMETVLLGVFAGHLHVFAAHRVVTGEPFQGPTAPYADLPLYRA